MNAQEELAHLIKVRDEAQTDITRARAQKIIDHLKAQIPQGLGDRIESALKLIGIQQAVKAVEKITGKDCGCAKRKQVLNDFGRKFGIGA